MYDNSEMCKAVYAKYLSFSQHVCVEFTLCFLKACGLPNEHLQVLWEKFHGEVVPIKDLSQTLKDTGLHRRSKVSSTGWESKVIWESLN